MKVSASVKKRDPRSDRIVRRRSGVRFKKGKAIGGKRIVRVVSKNPRHKQRQG